MTSAHVLIVTTDWITGRGCEQSLEVAGYRVTAHTTAGDRAVADLRRDLPALTLIENDRRNIPVARVCESAGVPMVYVHRLLTGDAWHGNPPGLDGRPVAHLMTPFNEAQLLNTVATALGRSSSWRGPSVPPTRAWRALSGDSIEDRLDGARNSPMARTRIRKPKGQEGLCWAWKKGIKKIAYGQEGHPMVTSESYRRGQLDRNEVVNSSMASKYPSSSVGEARKTMRKKPSFGLIPNPDPWTHKIPVSRSRPRMNSSSVRPGGRSTLGMA